MQPINVEPEIRPLNAGDLVALGELFSALAFDAATVRFFHPHPLTVDHAAELCEGSSHRLDRYFVAVENCRATGYFMLRGWDDGYSMPSFGAAVHPEHRGRGLGRRLLQAAIVEASAHGARQLRLTVYRANLVACRLYQDCGFCLQPWGTDRWLGSLDLDSAARRAA